MTKEVGHFLKCFLDILIFSFENSLFRYVSHLLIGLFSWYLVFEFFIGFEYESSTGCGVSKNLFPLCRLPLCQTEVFFAIQKLLSFMRSYLLIVDLSAYAIGVLFSKSFPVPTTSKLFPTFFSIKFSMSGFMLDSSLVQGDICIFKHAAIQFDQHHFMKMLSFFSVSFSGIFI